MNATLLIAAASTGVSVLTNNADIKTAIETGIANLSATVSDVLLIAVPAVVGVIALTAGVNFAMSKVRSVASWAS